MKRPQLTLRDLFWLVLVVGMGVGWWMDRSAAWRSSRIHRSQFEALIKHLELEGRGVNLYEDGTILGPGPILYRIDEECRD